MHDDWDVVVCLYEPVLQRITGFRSRGITAVATRDMTEHTETDHEPTDTEYQYAASSSTSAHSSSSTSDDELDHIERAIDRVDDGEDPYESVQLKAYVPRYIRADLKARAETYGEQIEALWRAQGAPGDSQYAIRLEQHRDELADLRAERVDLEARLEAAQEKATIFDERGDTRRAAKHRGRAETLRDQLDAVETEITDVTATIAELEAEQDAKLDAYHELLDALEQDLRDGKSVFEDHGVVQRAAETGGVPTDEVLEELRERTADIDTEGQFTEGTTSSASSASSPNGRRLRSVDGDE